VEQQDYLTIKYSNTGVPLWTARYDGPVSRADYATSIAVDGSGNAYVTGYSRGAGLDYATIKYNTNGAQQWVARYDGPAHSGDLAFAIALDVSGNVYVTGTDQKTLITVII
jgi:outer membrane protein assembly factor BamB